MLKNIEKTTGETPKSLRDRPLLNEAQHFFVSSFYDLNDSRSTAGSHHPITVQEILAYIQILGGFQEAEKYRFLKVIQALDAVFIQHSKEKDA